jgi:peptidyl-prolyl cis-trans isomerase D
MLAFFRAFAKSWGAKLLFGVLLVGFVILGIGTGLVPKLDTNVISAGQRSKTQSEFRDIIQRYQDQQRMQGQEVQQLDQAARLQIAQQLSKVEAYNAWIEDAGVRPDKTLLYETMRDIPAMKGAFNPVTGALDQTAFQTVLSQVFHMDEKTFKQALNDEIAQGDVQAAVAAGMYTPNFLAALKSNYAMQTRDASYFVLDPRALGPMPTPTDADLAAYYKDHPITRPEMRELIVVLFDPRKLAASQPVDPAMAKKEFEFHKDSYSTPEKRSFAVVTARDAKAAAEAASALRAGKPADAVAKATGGQVSNQKDVPKTAIPDAKVAAAVFGLKAGEVSGPVQAETGFVVVKLEQVTPGHAATFEEKRAEIEQTVRLSAAENKVQDMVQRYGELRDSGKSAAEAGREVGADVTEHPPVTAQGLTADGKPMSDADPNFIGKVVSDGFAMTKGGGNGQAKNLGQGVYYDVGVKAIHQPYTPKLDEVRAQVTQNWTVSKLAARVKAAGDDIVKRLKKGEPMDKVAESFHAKAEHKTGLKRPNPQDPNAGPLLMVFEAKKGDPVATMIPQQGLPAMLILQVDAVHAPATALGAQGAAQYRSGFDERAARSLMQSLQSAAVKKIDPKVNAENVAGAFPTTDQGQGAPSQ